MPRKFFEVLVFRICLGKNERYINFSHCLDLKTFRLQHFMLFPRCISHNIDFVFCKHISAVMRFVEENCVNGNIVRFRQCSKIMRGRKGREERPFSAVFSSAQNNVKNNSDRLITRNSIITSKIPNARSCNVRMRNNKESYKWNNLILICD